MTAAEDDPGLHLSGTAAGARVRSDGVHEDYTHAAKSGALPHASSELIAAFVTNMAARNLTAATQGVRRTATTALAAAIAPASLAEATTEQVMAWLDGYENVGTRRTYMWGADSGDSVHAVR